MRIMILTLLLLTAAQPVVATSNNATIVEIGTGTIEREEFGRLNEYALTLATNPSKASSLIAEDLASAVVHLNKEGLTRGTPLLPYYSVVFVATPPGEADPKIYRILLHRTASDSADLIDHLPGVRDFTEVFLSEDPDAKMDSSFSSSPVENPLQAQALKAIKFTEGGLAGLIGRTQEISSVRPATTPILSNRNEKKPAVHVTIRNVHLVDIRSTVSVSTIVSPTVEVDRGTLLKANDKTWAKLRRTRTLISSCADKLAKALHDNADKDLKSSANAVVNEADREEIRNNLVAAADNMLGLGDGPADADCNTDRHTADAAERIAAIDETLSAYLNLFSADDKPLTSNDSFSDTPLSHLDMGLAAGAILRIRGAERTKLNDAGNVVADPLSGLVSMAVLHWHPIAFDSATATPTAAERGSILFGFIVTPEPGLATGLSWTLFRGMNVYVSHDWLLVHEKKDETTLRRGWARAITFGFGYNFE